MTGQEAKRAEEAHRLEKKAATLRRQARAEMGGLDSAYLTQPVPIPGRERALARHRAALDKDAMADTLERRAAALRKPLPKKGDAAARKAKKATSVLDWIEPGVRVIAGPYGLATVIKVNRKTARVARDGWETTVALHLIRSAHNPDL